jgi:hypothetical protein
LAKTRQSAFEAAIAVVVNAEPHHDGDGNQANSIQLRHGSSPVLQRILVFFG